MGMRDIRVEKVTLNIGCGTKTPIETARTVLTQTLIVIDAFPPNYMSNLARRW